MKIIKFVLLFLVVVNSYTPKAQAMDKDSALFTCASIVCLTTAFFANVASANSCDNVANKISIGATVAAVLCLGSYVLRLHNRRTNQEEIQIEGVPNNA